MIYGSPGSGLTRAGKYKLGTRAVIYKFGAGVEFQGRGLSSGPGTKQRAGGWEIQIPREK